MQKLLIAVGVLVVLLAVTFMLVNRQKTADQGEKVASVELAKVDKGTVDQLSVVAPDKDDITLVKKDDKWWLAAPVEAIADQNAVDTALSKLAELEVVGTAASKEKNHALLEVDDAKGVRVTAKQGDKVVSDIIIGKYRSGNTMVRNHGETLVATAKGSMKYAFNKLTKEWRDRSIAKVEVNDASEVLFENPKGTLRFVQEGAAWAQAAGEKAIEEFDPNKVKSVVSSVANLRASDFAEPEVTPEAAGTGADAPGKVTLSFSTEGSEPVVLRVGNKEGANYYLQREGVDTIYMVSSYVGERLLSDSESFKKSAEPPEPPPTAQPAAHPQIPEGVKLPPGFKLPPGASVRTRESFEAERNK